MNLICHGSFTTGMLSDGDDVLLSSILLLSVCLSLVNKFNVSLCGFSRVGTCFVMAAAFCEFYCEKKLLDISVSNWLQNSTK